MASPAILILSTAPNREEAAAIAEALVTERLAACVQLSRIESRYRWDGKVEQANEIRLNIKTIESLAERVERRIAEMHIYSVPELVRIPIIGGSASYLDWIETSVAGD
jgi:periplasmic divalent cation tolerance protein